MDAHKLGEGKDVIDDLILRLDAFHIGTRWRIVGSEDASQATIEDKGEESGDEEDWETVCSDGTISTSSSDESSSFRAEYWRKMFQDRRAAHSPVRRGVPRPPIRWNASSSTIDSPLPWQSAVMPQSHLERYPLPAPLPGERPCWEPPILDYTDFEELIKAQEVINTRDLVKDVAWRTDIMDHLVERDVMRMFWAWASDSAGAWAPADREHEHFFRGLVEVLSDEMAELYEERRALDRRYEGRDMSVFQFENALWMEAFPGRYISEP